MINNYMGQMFDGSKTKKVTITTTNGDEKKQKLLAEYTSTGG